MPVVISGTNGVSGVDGTASNPSYEGTDSNTGIFFPAADTIAFAEGGTEVARFDSSGNFGIGTSSPSTYGKFVAYSSGGYGNITTDGHFESYQLLDVATAGGRFRGGSSQGSLGRIDINQVTTGAKGGEIRFFTCPSGTNTETERARITSAGDFVVGDTSAGGRVGAVSSANSRVLYAFSTASSGFTDAVLVSEFRNYSPNNTTARLLYTGDNAAERCSIRSNGGIANYTANNSPLSDRRLKRGITPAGSYLEKICSIPVVNYFYNDQTDDLVNLGVIAQDVLAAAPELCNEEGWGTKAEDGTTYLGIWETDIMYALMKCIQEQQQMIETLQAKVAALEAK
jgi:hypothetical protein